MNVYFIKEPLLKLFFLDKMTSRNFEDVLVRLHLYSVNTTTAF